MDRLTEVLHWGLLSCQGIYTVFCCVPKLLWQWWRNIFTERLRDCADIHGSINRAILQTVVTSCICVCCCLFVLLHECKLGFRRCYSVPCFFSIVTSCFVLSLDFFALCFELVEGVLMTTRESNHSEQTVWTRMVRLPEKPFPVLVWLRYGPIYIPTIPLLFVHGWSWVCFYLVCFLWMPENQVAFCTWDDNTNIEATTVWRQCEDIWID